MGVGFQLFDETTGALLIDVQDRITRIVAVINCPQGATGTQQLPEGTPFWYSSPNNAATNAGSAYVPLVSVNGSNLLTWQPNTIYGTGQVDTVLIVGVY